MATGDSPMLSKQANLQAGLPPSKQLQSEEQLPALDEEERKAVHARARSNLAARSSFSPDTRGSARSPSSKTPKSSSRLPGYMTPKSGGRSSRTPKSSRSSALTNRTSSPTGRYHPDPERRLDVRKVRAHPSAPTSARYLSGVQAPAAAADRTVPPAHPLSPGASTDTQSRTPLPRPRPPRHTLTSSRDDRALSPSARVCVCV